ncbi:MAG TPA: homoserine kinase [Streptosporangiaceae bacterium]
MSWPENAAGRVRVRVPATSANLGPGFDALGLALSWHDEVEAELTDGGLAIEVTGEGAETADAGERHLVVRAMRAAFAAAGLASPGLALRCVNTIPQGRGLGSSAGAVVAGLLAGRALAGRVPVGDLTGADPYGADLPGADASGTGAGASGAGASGAGVPGSGASGSGVPGADRRDARALATAAQLTDVTPLADKGSLADGALLALATRLEGHPDNAAACLAGGLTVAWTAAGGPRAVRLEPHPGIVPVVCVPAVPVATTAARQALPATVSHQDAAANAGRSALLVAALTQRPDLLFDATEDRLHQPYRAPLMPAAADLIGRLRAAGIAAVLSGAGPTVIALTVRDVIPGPREVDSIVSQAGNEWHVSPLDVDTQGATIQSVPSGTHGQNSVRHGRQGTYLQAARAGHAVRSPQDRRPPSAQHGQL